MTEPTGLEERMMEDGVLVKRGPPPTRLEFSPADFDTDEDPDFDPYTLPPVDPDTLEPT